MRNREIIMSSVVHFSYHATAMLARQFARENRVIYLEPGPWYQQVRNEKKQGQSYYKSFFNLKRKQVFDNLLTIQLPPMLPLLNKTIMQYSIRLSKLIQAQLLKRELKSLGFFPDIFILDNPLDIFMIRKFEEKISCTVITDEHSMLPHLKFVADVIEQVESQGSHRFDFIFATSRFQFEKRKDLNKNSFLVPNAVDIDLFDRVSAGEHPEPADLEAIPRPRIGYVGSICSRLDYDLLHKIANEHLEWSIVMIGGPDNYVPKDLVERLRKLPNVFILPKKDHEEIPRYMAKFDIGIIPFELNSLTKTMNLLKMYEYLAMGLPVVSTELPEVKLFSEEIKIARNHEEFVNLIEDELRTNNPLKIQRRIEVAKENSWEKRAEQISSLVDEYLQ